MPTAAATSCCSAMYISKYRSGWRRGSPRRRSSSTPRRRGTTTSPRAVAERRAAPRRRPSGSRPSSPDLPRRQLGGPVDPKRCGSPVVGLGTSTTMFRTRPAPRSPRSGWSSALPCQFSLVLDRLDALALDRVRDDHRRLAGRVPRLGVGAVDRLEVVPVDLDRVPAERLGPLRVRVEVPAVHGLAALPEPVHVDDRGQVARARRTRRARTPPTSSPRPSRCRRTGTQTRYGSRSRFLPARATPTAIGSPWPSEPVATSTHGISGSGDPPCGCRRSRNVRSSSSVIAPAALNIE